MMKIEREFLFEIGVLRDLFRNMKTKGKMLKNEMGDCQSVLNRRMYLWK